MGAFKPTLVVAAGCLLVATVLGACDPPSEGISNVSVVNTTNETLTLEIVDAGMKSSAGPYQSTPAPVTLPAGERYATGILIDAGTCVDTGLKAFDQTGHLIDALPSPICRGKHQAQVTWNIARH